jgi:FkbM family methyltransferase
MGRVRAIGKYVASTIGLYGPARILYRGLIDTPGRKRNSIRRFYRQIVKPGDLVFDIGANVGVYSKIFASLGAHVVAVEPLPENVVILQHCAYKKRIRVVQAAAGPHIGTGKIRRAQAHTNASMSREWIDFAEAYYRMKAIPTTWLDEIEVPTTTLDELSQTNGAPDFIKIDVEGYEESVLDGLSRQPPCISFEFNPLMLQMAQRCLEKPIFSPASECNFVVGEPERFVLDAWTNKGSVLRHIIASRPAGTWLPGEVGDIFIKRPRG